MCHRMVPTKMCHSDVPLRSWTLWMVQKESLERRDFQKQKRCLLFRNQDERGQSDRRNYLKENHKYAKFGTEARKLYIIWGCKRTELRLIKLKSYSKCCQCNLWSWVFYLAGCFLDVYVELFSKWAVHKEVANITIGHKLYLVFLAFFTSSILSLFKIPCKRKHLLASYCCVCVHFKELPQTQIWDVAGVWYHYLMAIILQHYKMLSVKKALWVMWERMNRHNLKVIIFVSQDSWYTGIAKNQQNWFKKKHKCWDTEFFWIWEKMNFL